MSELKKCTVCKEFKRADYYPEESDSCKKCSKKEPTYRFNMEWLSRPIIKIN